MVVKALYALQNGFIGFETTGLFYGLKAMLAYLFGDYPKAVTLAERAEADKAALAGLPTSVLANLYHLSLRPGTAAIAALGGIHRFTGWNGPILTDSGGFQVFSLSGLRKVEERGVAFRSHLDGALLELSPEGVVGAQEAMGVDIAMVLDECPPYPVSEAEAERALARTERWAERSLAARASRTTALFGIAQNFSSSISQTRKTSAMR